MRHHQRGGFAAGFLAGVVLGVVVSLGVALYVTKVPVPFVNKVQQRTAEQEAAEMEKNRNWDPNSPLYGRTPARPTAPGAPGAATPPGSPAVTAAPSVRGSTGAVTSPVMPGGPPLSPPTATRDPADILADRPTAALPPATTTAPPLSTRTAPDPFSYFVQAGAYNRGEDAEQQRARLAMLGFTARVTEREQAGRTVYRVRLGPFERRDDAETTRQKLGTSGVESALIPVQK
jgi:cell division protein FtsN